MFDRSKKNFKELSKDVKGVVCSAVCLVIHTVKTVPALCLDVRDAVTKRTEEPVQNVKNVKINA